MKKIFYSLLIMILIITSFNIESFANTQGSIKDVKINVKEEEITLIGTTSGNTDGMTINISIINTKQEIEYFDQITIRGNRFNLTLIPKSAVKEDRLMLKISGDLIFTKEFTYREDTSVEQENTNMKIQRLKEALNNKYKTYTDYSGNLIFEYTIEEIREGNYVVKMKGINFTRKDSSWTSKQEKRFETFLRMIGDEAFIVLKTNVQIQVLDGDAVIKTYRHNAKLDKKEYDAKELERLLNSKNKTFKDSRSSFSFIYKVDDINYAFNIKMQGTNFKQNDGAWKNRNIDEFIKFLDNIVKELKNVSGKDFIFNIYDKEEHFIDSFSYYNDRYEKEFKREYDYEDISGIKKPEEVNISEFFEYGKNAGKVDEKYINKTFVNNTFNIELNNVSAVREALSKLKSNQQKEVVIEGLGDFENKIFNIDRSIVSEVIKQNAILTLSTDNFHLHLDYSKLKNYDGNIVLKINTSQNEYYPGMIGSPVDISLNVGNKTLSGAENGVMATISYKLNQTRAVKDLRTLNVFSYNKGQWILKESRLNREKYGVSYIFEGNGRYSIIDNAKTFDDIQKHWGKQQIELLASKNIIAGKGNNKFDPDGTVTRAEFITMVVRKLNLPQIYIEAFTDTKQSDWFYGYVNAGAQYNLLPPTFTGSIQGNKPITREEMAYIVMKAYDYKLTNKKVQPSALFYNDASEVSFWARDNISRATELKIIQGWNNNFKPKDNATRAESATMLYNLFRAEGIFSE